MILADYFRSEHDTAWDIAISSGVRHGVIKKPNQKEHPYLIINPETAPVVKRIFELYAGGTGIRKICAVLEKEQIMSPSVYAFKRTGNRSGHPDLNNLFRWTQTTVRGMLANQEYCGDTDGTANGNIKCLKTAVTGRHYAFRLHTAPLTPLRTTGKRVSAISVYGPQKRYIYRFAYEFELLHNRSFLVKLFAYAHGEIQAVLG